MWLGALLRSGENNIAATDGMVYRVGTQKRRAPEERWNPAWLAAIAGTPGQPSANTRDGRLGPHVWPGHSDDVTPREEFAPAQAGTGGPERLQSTHTHTQDVNDNGGIEGCTVCIGLARGYLLNPPGLGGSVFLSSPSSVPMRWSSLFEAM